MDWGPFFLGSSRDTGEGGADLEEEIFLVAVPVSPTLDDLDGVVDALDDAGVERVSAASHDAVPVGLQPLGKRLQGGDAALLGLLDPLLPGRLGRNRITMEPEPFQFVAQQINAE